MPNAQYRTENDAGFLGFDSRTNPALLKPQMLQYAQNVRLERGEARKRKGLERLDDDSLVDAEGNPYKIYATTLFVDQEGLERIALVSGTALILFNPSAVLPAPAYQIIPYPTGRLITEDDEVMAVQALNSIYIFRGLPEPMKECVLSNTEHPHTTVVATCVNHGFEEGDEIIISDIDPANPIEDFYTTSAIVSSVVDANTFTYTIPSAPSNHTGREAVVQRGKPTLVWEGGAGISVVEQGTNIGLTAKMPPSDIAIYYGNRMIVRTDRNSIAASDYLDFNTFDLTFGQFTINQGANDYIVGITPWADDEFLIFQRNSIYIGRVTNENYDVGEGPDTTSYIKTLTNSFGSVARRTIINTGRYVFFLSDAGVFLLEPQFDLRLINTIDPLSAPIDNIINDIREDLVKDSVGVYFNNRIYLAVPVGPEATGNNRILVFNFLNKMWESIDTFGNDYLRIDDFVICQKNERKRLYIVGTQEANDSTPEVPKYVSSFNLYEEFDEGDENTEYGIPRLPKDFRLLQPWVDYPDIWEESDFPIFDPEETYPPNTEFGFMQGGQKYVSGFYLMEDEKSYYQVESKIVTRKMIFETADEKRFSAARVDATFPSSGEFTTEVKVYNPDQDAQVDQCYTATANDVTRRVGIGRRGYAVDITINSTLGRPVIRGISVDATITGRSNRSQK